MTNEGIANVLRKTIKARATVLDEMKTRDASISKAIAIMEQLQAEDIARLKEVEGRNEQP